MRNHYAIAKFDDLGRLKALKVRIDDTMYIASPHDDGKGEREVFIDIDTRQAVGEKTVRATPDRKAQLERAVLTLKKRYSR